jgi:hypothetical protein
MARAVGRMRQQAALQTILMTSWNATIEPLIHKLARDLTETYLNKFGLKLTSKRLDKSIIILFAVESADKHILTGYLGGSYRQEELVSSHEAIYAEMTRIINNDPDVTAPASAASSGSSLTGSPPLLATAEATTATPVPWAETLSVTVPPNSGDVIFITSATTGRSVQVTVPPGALPGSQFLVRLLH